MAKPKPIEFMKFYVTEYVADTTHLSAEENGAYMRIILNYWQRGKGIPENRLRGVIGPLHAPYSDVIEALQDYFVIENNIWYHERIEFELEEVRKHKKASSEGGKKSAIKRWGPKSLKTKAEITPLISPVTGPSKAPVSTKGPCKHIDIDIDKEIKKKSPSAPKKNTSAKRFIKPTHSELEDKFKERGLDETNAKAEATNFLNHYESNGWKVGRNKMASWPHSVTNWLKDKDFSTPAKTSVFDQVKPTGSFLDKHNDPTWHKELFNKEIDNTIEGEFSEVGPNENQAPIERYDQD